MLQRDADFAQLWDVCSDQEAVDLVRNIPEPSAASKLLVDHALSRFSTDNLSCMIVRFNMEAVVQSQEKRHGSAESGGSVAKVSEVEKIVMDTKQKIADGSSVAVGVSASNSGRGYDHVVADGADFPHTALDGTVEEEPMVVGRGGGADVATEKDAKEESDAEQGTDPSRS